MTFTIGEHLIMWSISLFFIFIYCMYDRSDWSKKIGDLFLAISVGGHNKRRILYMSFPPLVVSLLSIICDKLL
jgi:hypothetical protein